MRSDRPAVTICNPLDSGPGAELYAVACDTTADMEDRLAALAALCDAARRGGADRRGGPATPALAPSQPPRIEAPRASARKALASLNGPQADALNDAAHTLKPR